MSIYEYKKRSKFQNQMFSNTEVCCCNNNCIIIQTKETLSDTRSMQVSELIELEFCKVTMVFLGQKGTFISYCLVKEDF